jgi:uncharacterized protein
MRPPATWSAYHRFENALFDEVVRYLSCFERVKIVLLARYAPQAAQYRAWGLPSLIVPDSVLDGLNLVYWSDLVISAGGSMNREAAVLGVPAYTVFAGRMAGVDRQLIAKGELGFIGSRNDLDRVRLPRKRDRTGPMVGPAVVEQVIDAILTTGRQ